MAAFPQGLRAGAEVVQGSRRLDLKEQQLSQQKQQKRVQQVNGAISEAIKSVSNAIKNADQAGIPRDDPRLRKFVDTVGTSAIETATQFRDLPGVPDPEVIQSRIESSMQFSPTPEQEIAREAQQEGAVAQAKAAGRAAGTPEEVKEQFGAIHIPTDERVTAVRTDQGLALERVDEQGNRIREPVASEDIRPIETTEQFEQRQPFTQEEFIQPTSQQPQVDFEKGVGPLDAAARVISGTPVLGQILGEIGGEGSGQEQRRANAVFQGLENRVLSAFRPGLGGRITNFEMQRAQREVPQFGAFATEQSSLTDLKTLKERAQAVMDQSLQIANNPNRFNDELVKDAQSRLQSLGEVISITDSLIQTGESPEMETLRILGKPVDEVGTGDLNKLGERIGKGEVSMSEPAADILISQLDQQQIDILVNAMERNRGGE